MKKIFLIILIALITIPATSAKIYYFKDLKGIVDATTANTPFSDGSDSGDTETLDVSLSFNNTSLYIYPNDEESISYILSGDDSSSVTLYISSSNEDFISSTNIILDTSNSIITIPSSETSSNGECVITLTAKNNSGELITSTNFNLIITELSSDNVLTKWTVTAGQTVSFPFYASYSTTYTGNIDWGDGSDVQAFSGVKIQSLSHTYTDAGTYDIRIDGDFVNKTNLNNMFYTKTIPSGFDISTWDVSKITSMINTFYSATFPEGFDISTWDTSSLTNMQSTFNASSMPEGFDISTWDVSNVTSFYYTFCSMNLAYGLDLSSWDMTSNITTTNLFKYTTISGDVTYNETVSESVYTKFLQVLANSSSLFPSSSTGQKIYVGDNYCSDTNSSCLTAEKTLNNKGWDIVSNHSSDYVISDDNMLTRWTVSDGQTVTFPTNGSYFTQTFTGHIDWGDDSEVESFAGEKLSTLTHTYTNTGTYDIRIDGDFYGLSNASHIFRSVNSKLSGVDISSLNMSNVTDASYLFQGTTVIPSGFDVSWNNFTPTNIYGAFWGTTATDDLDLSSWDTSNVTNIGQTFRKTLLYGDLNLSGWDLSKVSSSTDFISGITTFSGNFIYDETVSNSVYKRLLQMLISGGFPSSSSHKFYVGGNTCADTSCTSYETTITNKGWVITRTKAE